MKLMKMSSMNSKTVLKQSNRMTTSLKKHAFKRLSNWLRISSQFKEMMILDNLMFPKKVGSR